MKQQDLAKIKWNDNTIDLYTQVLNKKIPANITKQQLRTIVKNINTYKLELDDNDTIIYTPNNVKIISPSRYDNILQQFYNSTQLGLGKGIKKFHPFSQKIQGARILNGEILNSKTDRTVLCG